MPSGDAANVEEVQRFLGQRIRDLRNKQGLSQEEFAGLCGLHRTYIGHVERGEKNVSLSTVLTVAGALGVHLSDLFRRRQRPSKTQPVNKQFPRKQRGSLGFPVIHIPQVLQELQSQRKALRQTVRDLRQLLARNGQHR